MSRLAVWAVCCFAILPMIGCFSNKSIIAVLPQEVAFTAEQQTNQILMVTILPTDSDVSWTAVSDDSWIEMVPSSGRGNANVQISVVPEKLPATDASTTVLFGGEGLSNSVIVSVTWKAGAIYADEDTGPVAAPETPKAFPGIREVLLRWRPNTESNLLGYKVFRDGFAITPSPIKYTSYRDTTGVVGQEYSYTLKAVNIAQSESAHSGAVRAHSGEVSLWTPDVVAGAGSRVRVPVNISNVSDLQASGFALTFTYDDTLVETIAARPSAISAGISLTTTPGGPGIVTVTSSTEAWTMVGEGALFEFDIKFHDGAALLNYESRLKITSAVFRTAVNAQAQGIFDVNGSRLATYDCAAGDAWHEMGDLVDDCQILEDDAISAMDIGLAVTTPAPWQLVVGDLNGDTLVDVADGVAIKRAARNLSLSPEKRLDMPVNPTVAIPEIKVQPGETVDIPVVVSDASGLAAASATVGFGQTLEFVEVRTGSIAEGFTIRHQTGPGFVKVAVASHNPVPHGAGAVIVLRFRARTATTKAASSAPIRLNGVTLAGAYGQNFDWYGGITLKDGRITQGTGESLLTVSTIGRGSVSPAAGVHVYKQSETVPLAATALEGWRFSHWTGNASGKLPSISLVMNAHKMVTAVFVPDLYISPNPGDLATLDGMPFVWCPSGTFSMGDPEFRGEPVQGYPDMTPHLVTLTEGFWMGQYEVTRQQWTDVMGTEPWRYCELPAAPTSPAVCISWTEAAGVAGFLENLNERSMDATFRLPTEAEWEYACRADMTTRFYWGDDPQLTEGNRYAWTAMNAGRELQAVGLKLPNAWNLYDMSGNAWEFVQDWFDTYPTGPATDPTGPQTGTYKAIRGGGIDGGLYDCMSFWRGYLQTTTPVETMGFRIVAIPRDVASY